MPANDPTLEASLARAQAKAVELPEVCGYLLVTGRECDKPREHGAHKPYPGPDSVGMERHPFGYRSEKPETRRCLFGHSVPANQGYSVKAGFVCYSHSHDFDGGK